MRAVRIEVEHFRSIKHLRLDLEPYVSLVGPNNHGKSNIIAALSWALDGSKANDDDFHCLAATACDMWVDVTFEDLTDDERTTFRKYLDSDSQLRIRKTARRNESGGISVQHSGWITESNETWLQSASAKDLAKRDAISETPLASLVPQTGRLTQDDVLEAQGRYIEEHRDELTFTNRLEVGPLLGQKSVSSGVLPEVQVIPAVRDLSDETKTKSTSSFGRLLQRAVDDMLKSDPRFSEIAANLERALQSLNDDRAEDGRPQQLVDMEAGIQRELAHWNAGVKIVVNPPDVSRIFELGTEMLLEEEGILGRPESKGHGLQRAALFALVRAWARALRTSPRASTSARSASDSIILCVEEPELFLHPHAQRRLAAALRDIAGTEGHQVIVATHSTQFIDVQTHREIALVSKESVAEGTKIRQCLTDVFAGDGADERKARFRLGHWVDPLRSEMFFARKTVFVEGETEAVVLPYLAARLGCHDLEVSVVDCGSKFNLPLYMKLANAFSLSYAVVHDEDPVPDDCPEEKLAAKQRTMAMNGQIAGIATSEAGVFKLCPDFEGMCGVSKRSGDRLGKPLAAIEYFESLQDDELPEGLVDLVESVYA